MDTIIFSPREQNQKESQVITNNPVTRGSKWYNYIPSGAILIFRRLSVWFYLIAFCIQCFIETSIDISYTLVPLILTILTTITIDLIQNARRKKTIKRINNLTCTVYRNNEWIQTTWGTLKKGEIVKMQNNDVAPADLILLFTSDGQPISVETHIIDGSTQLSPRYGPELSELLHENTLLNSTFTVRDINRVKYEEPNTAKSQLTSKYNFFAKIDLGSKQYDLTNKNFIERYSYTYHSGYILCGVVFTGEDCWTVKNTPIKHKFSLLENVLNDSTLFLIGFSILFSIIAASFSLFYTKKVKSWPFEFDLKTSDFFLQNMWNYLILLIPISPLELYPLLDFIFIVNSFLITMSLKKSTTPNIRVLDEISHVDTVITSKSMLLEHKPTLKRIYLNGKSYGMDITTRQLSQNIENDLLQNRTMMSQFYDSNLKADESNHMFFVSLTLCHSASIVGTSDKFNYISRFPDDEHLLRLAALNGYILMGRNENESIVRINGKTKRYKTKRIIHSSLRHPRISIIVEDEEGTIILFTRGVYKTMINIVDDNEKCVPIYDTYHEEGLHVETASYQYITPLQYQQFEQKMAEFGEGNVDFEFSVVESLEKHSVLLAMFGFEDQPRDGALIFLARVKNGCNQIVLSSQSKGTSLIITGIALGLINLGPVVGTIKGPIIEDVDISISYVLEQNHYDVLIISGQSVEFLLQSEYAYEVAQLILNTKVIILQRSDQLQASQFIEYLQNVTNQVVMAVGHSVYDSVYMAQANVSCAVRSNEIQPCSVTSDIVVNNFENLCDVIFLHGVYLRERVRTFLNYIIPRNMVTCFAVFWYGIFNCFSGTPLFREADYFSMMYFFTLVPVMSRSIFNIKEHMYNLLSDPSLYKNENEPILTKMRILMSFCGSLLLSFALIFVSKVILSDSGVFMSTISIPHYSHAIMGCIVYGSLGFVLPTFDTWNLIHHFLVWGSQILFYTSYRVATELEISKRLHGVTHQIFIRPNSILMMFLSLFLGMFFSASFQIFKKFMKKKKDISSQ